MKEKYETQIKKIFDETNENLKELSKLLNIICGDYDAEYELSLKEDIDKNGSLYHLLELEIEQKQKMKF